MHRRPYRQPENPATPTSHELRERLPLLLGVAPAAAAAGEALVEAAVGGVGGGVGEEVIVGGVAAAVDWNLGGDTVVVEAVLAELVLALVASGDAELLTVGMGLTVGRDVGEAVQCVPVFTFDSFVHAGS